LTRIPDIENKLISKPGKKVKYFWLSISIGTTLSFLKKMIEEKDFILGIVIPENWIP
jgi:hypothetical protein